MLYRLNSTMATSLVESSVAPLETKCEHTYVLVRSEIATDAYMRLMAGRVNSKEDSKKAGCCP